MLRFLLLFPALLFLSPVLAQPENNIEHTLYLIGDAGEPYVKNSNLGKLLREYVASSGSNTTVLFLGDNVYPKGMPAVGERRREESVEILQTQVEWVKGLEANTIFIPGNHDWLKGKRKGWERITNQQAWIDTLKDRNITLQPKDGCPGPVEIQLSDGAILVI